MRTFWISALALLGAAYCLAETPAKAPAESAGFTFLFREVPKDWTRYEGQDFSMMVPPDLVRKDVQREDSRLTQLVGPKIRFDIRYGLYVGTLPAPDSKWKDYRVEKIEMSGRHGHLVSYIADKRFAADAVFPEAAKIGRDSVGLSVHTLSVTSEDRGWAVTALRSIRMKSR